MEFRSEGLKASPFRVQGSGFAVEVYRGASFIRNRPAVGPHIRAIPRALWAYWGVGVVL